MHHQEQNDINWDKIISALTDPSEAQELSAEERSLLGQLAESRTDKSLLHALEHLHAGAAWQRVSQHLGEQAPVVSLSRGRKLQRLWAVAAAVIGLVLLGGGWFYYQSTARTVIQTQYGEFRKVVLPDGTVVKLNPDSRLEFPKKWNKGAREVWLDGEAFLDVAHLHQQGRPVAEADRFVVHADDMDIEVLGTSFLVNVRHETSQVILQSGKIKLHFDDHKIAPMEVKPGEKVEYAPNEGPVKEKIQTDRIIAWEDEQLHFNSTPLKEVFKMLEDNYGWKVVVADTAIMSRTMTGSVSTENKEVLLKALSITMHLTIHQESDTLIIEDQSANQ